MSKIQASRQIEIEVPTQLASGYSAHVDCGIWRSLPKLLLERCPAARYAMIADETVADLYAEELLQLLHRDGLAVDIFSFPPGEAFKNRAMWAELTDEMLTAGYGRDSVVIALGGGVTGDLAGFVAATYMRGLPLVQLPTTLLAMVDSSVGGKTGVDTAAGKNLVGAFHPPSLVVADIRSLATLPAEHLSGGLAESIKHGAIADPEYLKWVEITLPRLIARDEAALTALVIRSMELKAEVVSRDEREAGRRKILNFGHTLGHALESATGYAIHHGAAVAIGMVLEARLGERLGVTAGGTADRLRELLVRAGLPTEPPERLAAEAILAATRTDKKARAGQVEYVLLETVGEARWGIPVEDGLVKEVLTAGLTT